MVDSFNATAKISTLRICLDNDDPCLNEYLTLLQGSVPVLIEERRTTTEIINERWPCCAPCFKYFSVTNDDFVYRTKAWDLKLVEEIVMHGGIGIAYGNDLAAGPHIPTCSIISRKIVEILGWLQLPSLTHLYGDNVWKMIGIQAGCLYYRQDIVIEHMHYFVRKANKDSTFEHTNSQEMYQKDGYAFADWVTNHSKEDIAKVKELLCLPHPL